MIGYQVTKDGDVVAEARIADGETPSSVSLLYRETLGDEAADASFLIQFVASPELTDASVMYAENNIQVGV